MWFCYIKPNRHVHSSGFRCFEVGYCTIDGHKKVVKKVVLGEHSDAIHLYDIMPDSPRLNINLDVTKDGHIRLFGDGNFHWHDTIMSDAFLEIGSINEKWCEQRWKKQQEKDHE